MDSYGVLETPVKFDNTEALAAVKACNKMGYIGLAGNGRALVELDPTDESLCDTGFAFKSNMKDHPYEEAIGVPLIISDPNSPEQNGLTIDTPISTEDLFPTLLGLAGLTPSRTKPGLDLTPMIQGRMSNLPREGVLLELVHDLRPASDDNPFHAFHYHAVYWRGFRTHRYKYTVLGDSEQGGKPWQFFDLQADPYEMNNLISDDAHRELVAHHHRLMRQRMIDTNDHYVLAPAHGQEGMNQWLADPL